MVIQAISGAYLLVGFRSQGSRDSSWGSQKHYIKEVRVKVHRNTVFVIERETYMDAAWHHALDLTDMVASTTPGKKTYMVVSTSSSLFPLVPYKLPKNPFLYNISAFPLFPFPHLTSPAHNMVHL